MYIENDDKKGAVMKIFISVILLFLGFGYSCRPPQFNYSIEDSIISESADEESIKFSYQRTYTTVNSNLSFTIDSVLIRERLETKDFMYGEFSKYLDKESTLVLNVLEQGKVQCSSDSHVDEIKALFSLNPKFSNAEIDSIANAQCPNSGLVFMTLKEFTYTLLQVEHFIKGDYALSDSIVLMSNYINDYPCGDVFRNGTIGDSFLMGFGSKSEILKYHDRNEEEFYRVAMEKFKIENDSITNGERLKMPLTDLLIENLIALDEYDDSDIILERLEVTPTVEVIYDVENSLSKKNIV
jgi:hypothetical protein